MAVGITYRRIDVFQGCKVAVLWDSCNVATLIFERFGQMKQIQISEELFIQLIWFHLCDDDLWQEEIEQGLQSKLDTIINRNLYTRYKSADTEEEREKARIEYLDRKGYHPDWRW